MLIMVMQYLRLNLGYNIKTSDSDAITGIFYDMTCSASITEIIIHIMLNINR